MPFNRRRQSSMDFSDGKIPSLEQHPDIVINANQPSHLQRNKTERRRLQGLQRTNTTTAQPVAPYVPRTTMEKYNHWMINEGGRRMFFFVFLFLHALVIAFGFMHYQLKDSSVTARGTFGITFRECLILFLLSISAGNAPSATTLLEQTLSQEGNNGLVVAQPKSRVCRPRASKRQCSSQPE